MSKDIGYGVPETYDYINMYNSSFSPSTVHVKNVALQRFFRRYLFQKAISVFKWKLPETWNRDYFLYVLYAWGYIGVVETNKYGVICQAGVPYGYERNAGGEGYRPTNARWFYDYFTSPDAPAIIPPEDFLEPLEADPDLPPFDPDDPDPPDPSGVDYLPAWLLYLLTKKRKELKPPCRKM